MMWTIGLATFAYYGTHPDPHVTSGDTAFFTFIATQLPSPLPGLMLAVMLAAVLLWYISNQWFGGRQDFIVRFIGRVQGLSVHDSDENGVRLPDLYSLGRSRRIPVPAGLPTPRLDTTTWLRKDRKTTHPPFQGLEFRGVRGSKIRIMGFRK